MIDPAQVQVQAGAPREPRGARCARSPWSGGVSRGHPEAFRRGDELALTRGRELLMDIGVQEHGRSFSPPGAVSELFRLR
jgi:hypothetical protein